MSMKAGFVWRAGWAGALAVGLACAHGAELARLPAPAFDPAQAELGRRLFFDPRLSGNATLACADCHRPERGWADGQPLSAGYPGSAGFRNSPTLLNAAFKTRFMWDGRLDGADMATAVRDMLTEAPTMNMDSRLLQERVKQVPAYVELWGRLRQDDPHGMRLYGVVGEFVKSLVSRNAPIDRFLAGERSALSDEQRLGYELFNGKAGCVACHHGPLGSDGQLHRLGVPEHPAIGAEPLRQLTMLRHFATQGMPNTMNTRADVGGYAITKDARDRGKFATPSLRELKFTAPYMHNGVFATLAEVIDFYDRGGGAGSELRPLNLQAGEKLALRAFLDSLSGEPVTVERPEPAPYRARRFGDN